MYTIYTHVYTYTIHSDAGIAKLPPEMRAQGGLQRRVDDLRLLVESSTPSILQVCTCVCVCVQCAAV